MPSTVKLTGVRGDGFERRIPLLTGSPARPLTPEELNEIRAQYPLIHAQVRKRAGAPETLIDLSSTSGELTVLDSSELEIRFAASKASVAGAFVYDVQFSGPQAEPFTLFGGTLTLTQDVTDAPAVT